MNMEASIEEAGITICSEESGIIATGMKKMTLMTNQGTRIKRVIGMILPNYGLLMKETEAGIEIWGEESSLGEVRKLLHQGLQKKIQEASFEAQKAESWLKDIQALEETKNLWKDNWY
jgi:hypothetical protein